MVTEKTGQSPSGSHHTDLHDSDHSLSDPSQTDCADEPTGHDLTPCVVDGSLGRFRSRAGRFLKPVSRLIEIMHQKRVTD